MARAPGRPGRGALFGTAALTGPPAHATGERAAQARHREIVPAGGGRRNHARANESEHYDSDGQVLTPSRLLRLPPGAPGLPHARRLRACARRVLPCCCLPLPPLSYGFNAECMATHRLLRCAATPSGRAATRSAWEGCHADRVTTSPLREGCHADRVATSPRREGCHILYGTRKRGAPLHTHASSHRGVIIGDGAYYFDARTEHVSTHASHDNALPHGKHAV